MNCKKRFLGLVLSMTTLVGTLALTTNASDSVKSAVGIVDASALRLREGPGTDTEILTTAYRNDYVVILESEGDWYKVSVDGKTGYMMAKYLKVTADMHNGTARVFNANGGSYVNFRSRASLSANVIGTVPVGTTVKVLEKTTDWTKVEVNGKTGYISTWFLKF